MNKKVCLILIAAAAAAPLASCRKAPETGPPGATAEAETAAETPTLVDIEGTYVGGGTDAEGQAYNCEVKFIWARQVYWVERYVDRRPMIPGVGIRRGDLFVVGFRDERDKYGVFAYGINADGSLEGTSAYQGVTKTGTEKLTKK